MSKLISDRSPLNKFTLSFPDERENMFRTDFFNKSINTTRLAFLFIIVLYGSFIFIDSIVAKDYLDYFIKIRFVLVLPVYISVILLSFTKNFFKYWQGLLSVAYIVSGLGIILMLGVVASESLYSNGMILIFLAGSVMIRLRFIYSTISGLIVIVLFNIFQLLIYENEMVFIITNNAFFISSLVIGALASYHIEVSDRLNFDLFLQLEKRNSEIEGINLDLENKVENRTKTLNNKNAELKNEIAIRIDIEDALISAKEKAEESDKLKSAFLANMSHEIRTPMNGIIGFASLLQDASDKEEQKEFIDIIIKSGDHLLNLINDILDLSVIESGAVTLNKEAFKINELANEVKDMFYSNTSILDKKLDLTYVEIPDEVEKVVITDRMRLKQVLINLINNAIKFTDKGGIEFGYKLVGKSLKFFVKDTGIGISKGQQKVIFNRFMQATTNITPIKESAGLGLAITKTYLAMMGGNIRVESKVGEGSKFIFVLPVEIEN